MSTRLQVGGMVVFAWLVALTMGGGGPSSGEGIAPRTEGGVIASAPARSRDEPRPERQAQDAVRVRTVLNGEHRVITLPVEAGAFVEKGALILELDSSVLEDRLANQQIETERAISNHANAQRDLEVAEIELQSYVEVDSPTELREAEERVELASLDFELAVTRFLSRILDGVGPARSDQELALQEASLEVRRTSLLLRRAERDLRTLAMVTHTRELMTRKFEIEKKKAELFSLKATADLQHERDARYRRMIDECTVVAPASGILRLADGLEVGTLFDFDWARPIAWIEFEPGEDAASPDDRRSRGQDGP